MEEGGKGDLEISIHFLNVGGKQVKGSEINDRGLLVGLWKNAWPTWPPRIEETQEITLRGRITQLPPGRGWADLFLKT